MSRARIALAALLLTGGLAAASFLAQPRKAAKLQGFDVLSLPGRSVTLRAKLEEQGILPGVNPDVHGEEIVFRLGDQEIGRARTAGDGIAFVEWTPPARDGGAASEIEVRASLGPASKLESPDARLRVFVRTKERPVLVVDLDGTVCEAGMLEVARKPPAELPACRGAAAALGALASTYDIVYLTARDDALLSKSRDWLDLQGFPRAPLLVRDLHLGNLSARRHKEETLLELKKEFRLAAGVGDRREDALAYLAAGMTAILVGDVEDVPARASKLASWDEVAKLLGP